MSTYSINTCNDDTHAWFFSLGGMWFHLSEHGEKVAFLPHRMWRCHSPPEEPLPWYWPIPMTQKQDIWKYCIYCIIHLLCFACIMFYIYKLVDKLSLNMFVAKMINWNDLVSCLVMSWIVGREQIPCSFHLAEPGYVHTAQLNLISWLVIAR